MQYSVSEHIDVIAIIESPDIFTKRYPGYRFLEHVSQPKTEDINVFIKDEINAFYTRERQRFCILNINNLNVAVAHLNSDYPQDSSSRRMVDINSIKEELLVEEKKYGNKNSIVIGDINAPLFSDEINGFLGFNARYFKFMSLKGQSSIHGVKEDIFYSPMLNIYNDSLSKDIAMGTYYYQNEIGWLCPDQVLIKTDLLDSFDTKKVQVLSSLHGTKLVNNYKPKASDHMPVYFELER